MKEAMKAKSIGRHARTKGANGEREIFKILSEKLGFKIERNLTQTRIDGGSDSNDLPGFSAEVKRQEGPSVKKWWNQTTEQAEKENKRPVLFYRSNRQPWKCIVSINFFMQEIEIESNSTAEISVDSFCDVYKLLYQK